MFEFIKNLCESSLFPSKQSLEKYSKHQLADRLLLYICAMHILFSESSSEHQWAKDYARKTIQYHDFDTWYNSSTDLYVLLYSILNKDEDWTGFRLQSSMIKTFLQDGINNEKHQAHIQKLFIRLDQDLNITNDGFRSLRRVVMDWDKLERKEKKVALTRIIQYMNEHMSNAEILSKLKSLSNQKNFHIDLSNELVEDATSGGTSSASVATVVGGLGTGFDNDYSKSIYGKPIKRKPLLIKR